MLPVAEHGLADQQLQIIRQILRPYARTSTNEQDRNPLITASDTAFSPLQLRRFSAEAPLRSISLLPVRHYRHVISRHPPARQARRSSGSARWRARLP